MKGDFCRTLRSDSMGIDIQIYIRREVHALPSTLFLSRSRPRSPSQRRITVRRIQLLGSTRGRKEKGWNLHSVFSLSLFSLFFSPFASFVCAACMISFRRRYSRNWSGNDAGRCKETFDPSSSSSAPCDRFPSILRKVSSRDRNRLRGGE